MNVLLIHNYLHDLKVFVLDRTLKCLSSAGHRVFMLSPRDARYTRLRFSRTCHKWLTCDIEALDAATINAYCREHSIDIVLPGDIGTTIQLARLQAEITPARTFPLASEATLNLLHNKGRFMGWLHDQGLPCPTTHLIEPETPLNQFADRYPLIAKPLENCGSRGVAVIESLDDLLAYAADHWSHTVEPFLVQTYIPGEDLVFGVLAEHGRVRAWTIQKFCDGDETQLEHVEYIEHPELLRCGEEIVRALNFHGVAEFDARLDAEGRIWFVECNPRFWASVAISMEMGVNYPDLGIKLAMEQPFADPRSALGSYIWPERALARLIRRQVRLSELSAQNRHAIITEISDPIPFVYTVYDWLVSK